MDVAALVIGASAVMALVMMDRKDVVRPTNTTKAAKKHNQLTARSAGITVPFRLIKENPILALYIEGDDGLTCWIVDTGYGYTAVDERLAKRLAFPNTGTLTVQTLQMDKLKSTTVPTAYVVDLGTNEMAVEVPPHGAVVRRLPSTLEDTYGRFSSCIHPGGILGITFLRNFVTRLDYRNNTLTFYDPHTFQPPKTGARFNGYLNDEHYFLVPMKVDGVVANLALDTGAFATIMTEGFLNKYERQKGYPFGSPLAKGRKGGTLQASFSETMIDLRKKNVDRVEVGNHMLTSLELLYPEDPDPPGLLSTTRFDGLLGYNVLRNFVIYLVYEPVPYVILQ